MFGVTLFHSLLGKRTERRRGRSPRWSHISGLTVLALAGAWLLQAGTPATALAAGAVCVNPGGTGGCYSTIQAGVDAVSPGGTVSVAAGTYNEDVSITKPLNLRGAGAGSTTIDATGFENGLVINGVNAATSVTGFTFENAKFEGIFVENSSRITVAYNLVTHNDTGLQFPNCPGNPFPLDSFDCGEGVHLMAVAYSTVSNNTITENSGGILLTDENGPTHGNTISANTVTNNVFDCGITLASHVFQLGSPVAPSVGGIYDNTVVGNFASGNGTIGQGGGVGIFAAQPGAAAYNNTVVHNTVTNNGLPGVAIHSHAPFQNVNGNTIVNNTISGNGADDEEGIAGPPDTTGIDVLSDPGAAPVTSVTISANRISDEHYGIFTANVLKINGLPSNKFASDVTVPVFMG